MNKQEILINVDEIQRYEEAVQAVSSGHMDEDRFMAFRLQHGIYGQRQPDVHMVRIKIPGGQMTSAQLAAIADAMERYSDDSVAQVTTRQDIQFHYIPLRNTPAMMRDLGEAGLTTREACGNTVRNVTACSLAGICPREHVDVTPFLDGVVARFLRHPLTQHLPRKFKMSFSGCESDCAMGLMHDIGIVATRQGERFGFRLLAGGGLGHKPRAAVVVEEFVSEAELIPCIEAVIALHNRYSDRKRRAKARIKFLVDKFGADGFIAKYREELERARAACSDEPWIHGQWQQQSSGTPCGAGAPRQVTAQKQPGLYVVPISLPRGDMSAQQMRGIARLMAQHDLQDLRTTVDQNLMITHVPEDRLPLIREGIDALGLNSPRDGDNVVTCPGTTTCRLGITSSKLVAPQLSGGESDLRVRVSGCHNSCGQHHVADIGIHGEGKRRHGKLIPSYVLHLGGDGMANGEIAMKGPVIPSLRVTQAVERIETTYREDRNADESFFSWSRRKGADYFNALLHDLAEVTPLDVQFLARDHGEEDTFKVLQLGGGECAGAAQDLVASNFSEAMHERTYRNAFMLQRKYGEAAECSRQIVRLVNQSLLFLAGEKAPDNDDEQISLLKQVLKDNPVIETAAQLLNELQTQENMPDPQLFETLASRTDQWMTDAGRFCQSVDSQLDLATTLPELSESALNQAVKTIDLTEYACPLHYIKARHHLNQLADGGAARFVFRTDDSVEQVAASIASDGHVVNDVSQSDNRVTVTVQKTPSAAAAL